jgi:hypothetical protein
VPEMTFVQENLPGPRFDNGANEAQLDPKSSVMVKFAQTLKVIMRMFEIWVARSEQDGYLSIGDLQLPYIAWVQRKWTQKRQ